MGATVLADRLQHPNIGLLPEGAEPAEEFLRSLSAFIYRIHPTWYECFGRVVAEAMACGLPAIVENRGGPREYIRDGLNGLLVESTEEMHEAVKRVRSDASLRFSLGNAARASMESLFSPQARREILDFYIR